MTIEDARALCRIMPAVAYTRPSSVGLATADAAFVAGLKAAFPRFNWRVILDRSGERSTWALTIDDNDPRVHYVPIAGTCVHCGKTAQELGVEERDEG